MEHGNSRLLLCTQCMRCSLIMWIIFTLMLVLDDFVLLFLDFDDFMLLFYHTLLWLPMYLSQAFWCTITQSMLHDSLQTLVFVAKDPGRHSNDIIPNEDARYQWHGEILISSEYRNSLCLLNSTRWTHSFYKTWIESHLLNQMVTLLMILCSE